MSSSAVARYTRFPWPASRSASAPRHQDHARSAPASTWHDAARRGAPARGSGSSAVAYITGGNGLVAWNICAGLVLVALIAMIIVFIVLVLVHNTEVQAMVNAAVPRDADVIQSGGPLLFLLRKKPAAQGNPSVSFLASTNAAQVALTTSPNDYAAAVRLVPMRQARPGVVSDGDSFKANFVRDGLWLGSDGKLTKDPGQAGSLSITVGGRNGLPLRTSDKVTVVTAGSDATTDPVASIFNSNGSDGVSIVPFLNGFGC